MFLASVSLQLRHAHDWRMWIPLAVTAMPPIVISWYVCFKRRVTCRVFQSWSKQLLRWRRDALTSGRWLIAAEKKNIVSSVSLLPSRY